MSENSTQVGILFYVHRTQEGMYAAMWDTDCEPTAVQGPLGETELEKIIMTKQITDDGRSRELFSTMLSRGDLVLLAIL